MDAETTREYLLGLPHVAETMQWGANLVFWVGDKAIGGKMFAVVNLENTDKAVLSFHAGQEHYADLLETEGVFPAPYLARAHWLSLQNWHVFPRRDLEELLERARRLVYDKLPRKTRTVLAMPPAAQRKLVKERKKPPPAKASSR
jgi:predicted DNA-binding protein (MmcQ/YjbR family)